MLDNAHVKVLVVTEQYLVQSHVCLVDNLVIYFFTLSRFYFEAHVI